MACLPERNLVIVVDDDAMMLKSVARLLRQLGYESVLFPSAETFANHGDFDRVICVLLDIDLGDVSGIDASATSQRSEQFRCRSSTSPRATAQPFARQRINPGASPPIIDQKPFSAESLAEQLCIGRQRGLP